LTGIVVQWQHDSSLMKRGGIMADKKTLEEPVVTTFRFDELIVEKAFTAAAPSVPD
jgi:hypothetical protein